MKWTRPKVKAVQTLVLILVVLAAMFEPVSAMIQAQIIPPDPFTVYTNQTYSISIGVQYNVPKEAEKMYGPYVFWIESPPYQTGQAVLSGSGVTAFSLTLRAPSRPGTYSLALKLLAQGKGQGAAIMDSATVPYQVIEPVVTDWDVEKVWIEPKSPGEGDQVTFHATIVLKSTTSSRALTVDVGCYLDKSLYYRGSLAFSPHPSTQDVSVPKPWTATKGSHSLICLVDPDARHNDPTPYPPSNFKELRFTVEPYYAIVQRITTSPSEVEEGGWFDVVITVEYRFSGTASLRVHHTNNATLPPVDDETSDSVTGSGSKDYAFRARAPYTRSANASCATWILQGSGSVMFDKGAGWQRTDPGWHKFYEVNVRTPRYYAVFDSVTAEYLGTSGGGANVTVGRIRITLQVRYLLPVETGLRIIVYRFYNTSVEAPVGTAITEIWRDEASIRQDESLERTATYTYEYTFPISSIRSATMFFNAVVDYRACGLWNRGDEASTSAAVPYTPPPTSIADYFAAAIQRIIDWIKRLLGQS